MSATTPAPAFALPAATLDWLLEAADPAARALALRDLLRRPPHDRELLAAQAAAHAAPPIATVLDAMHPDGYWVKPGAGYGPKYQSAVWALILLAQLGASVRHDERIARACAYYLDHALAPGGRIGFSTTAAATADCLQGNMCWALLALDYDDPRLDAAFEWTARSVTGEGIAPASERRASLRYYASGKCGPDFACAANNKLPCAWGAAKVMLAFGVLPAARRTPPIERAVARGVEFLLGGGAGDPATAPWPNGWAEKPSGNWWKFGFPVFYVTDLLQVAEALVALGHGGDARLARTLEVVRSKQDAQGRWPLEYTYGSKTWGSYGRRGRPNKWVTLRAARVLAAV